MGGNTSEKVVDKGYSKNVKLKLKPEENNETSHDKLVG